MNYQRLYDYSELMVRKNLAYFERNNCSGFDFVGEAILKTTDEEIAIKIIRGEILTEKRRLLAQKQKMNPINQCGEKTCRKCQKTKSFAEFTQRTDYRTDFKYFDSWCKECRREYYTSEEMKAKKRAYSKTEKQRENNRIRQQRLQQKKRDEKRRAMGGII
mgnify:CR=1 FL=1